MLAPIIVHPKIFLKFKFENFFRESKMANINAHKNAIKTNISFIMILMNIFFSLKGFLIMI